MPIDKLAWIYIKDRKVLFVRSHGKDIPYTPGGKREEGETDEEALVREIREELQIELVRNTIVYLRTVTAQAHGKPEGVMVEIKCYAADFTGTPAPSNEIEEMQLVNSADTERLSVPGKLITGWLKGEGLID
jgi:8-oxo-dGTP diphosphatase